MSIEGQKQKIVAEYGKNNKDTGSVDVQVALLTDRIKCLTEHMKKNKKDHSSKRGLQKLVGKRKRLLRYHKKNNLIGYRTLISGLKIRK